VDVTIRAVIWDFGGVFTTSPFEAFNRYEELRGLPRDLVRQVNSINPQGNAWARFERAEIDASMFDSEFYVESAALGYPIRGSDILPLLSGDVRPAMVDALRACKRRFKVGCITNNMAQGHGPGMSKSPSGATRTGEIMALFDSVIESSKAGVRKPDPKIYLMMCERLAVEPAACVYLDDLGINCKPAAALGMTAIKVVSQGQALRELQTATGLMFDEGA
jgi:putative hydrolase of the HAD superfamily